MLDLDPLGDFCFFLQGEVRQSAIKNGLGLLDPVSVQWGGKDYHLGSSTLL